MDKKTIIYSFKTIFKKTKLICPYCGTVQNYKKNSCCVCHKSLDSVKDNTLKIKNCIRAGIGILVLSVISVVTAMVINNALKRNLSMTINMFRKKQIQQVKPKKPL